MQRTELYKAIIGTTQTNYYLKRFASFDERGGAFYPSWNWAAFLSFLFCPCAPLWALYRGMYAVFFLFLFAIAIVIGASVPDTPHPDMGPAMGLGLFVVLLAASWIGFATYANALYYKHAQRRIRKAPATQKEHDDVRSHLVAERRGDAWNLVILALVCLVPTLFMVQAKNDYNIRYQVSLAASLADSARIAVDDAYEQGLSLGTIPVHVEPVDSKHVAYHVTSITTADSGTVTIQLNDHSHLGDTKNGIITYTAMAEGDHLEWTLTCNFAARWCPRK